MERIVLLDGDLLVYRHAAGAEEVIDWGEGQFTHSADMVTASTNLEAEVDQIQREMQADEVILCLSDNDEVDWRKAVMPEYKAHRASVRPPLIRQALKKFALEHFNSKTKRGLEGDDVMGIMATNPKLYPGAEKIIVSADKDMKTIPGQVHNGKKLLTISRKDADRWHMMQTLMGDKSDGYPGCRGVGPVKAEKIVEGGWHAIVEAFLKAGHTEEFALQNARVSRILRHEDFNYKTQEPILWQPSKH
jgi:DNA polymerase-1